MAIEDCWVRALRRPVLRFTGRQGNESAIVSLARPRRKLLRRRDEQRPDRPVSLVLMVLAMALGLFGHPCCSDRQTTIALVLLLEAIGFVAVLCLLGK